MTFRKENPRTRTIAGLIFALIPLMILTMHGGAVIAGDEECREYAGHPHVEWWFPLEGSCELITVSGDLAFMLGGIGGGQWALEVVDLSQPEFPVLRGSVETPGEGKDIVAEDGHVFIADADAGLTIVDVSNPDSPTLVKTIATPGRAFALAKMDRWLYLSVFDHGLEIYDVNDPQTASLVRTIDDPQNAYDLNIDSGRLYAAMGSEGISVYDLQDPSDPQQQGSFGQLLSARRLEVSGRYAYVISTNSSHLLTYDLNDFPDVNLIDHHVGKAPYNQLQVSDSLISAAASTECLALFERDNSGVPTFLGTVEWGSGWSYSSGVAKIGDTVYLAANSGWLIAVPLGDSRIPLASGWSPTAGNIRGMRVQGDYAYLAETSDGLEIFDVSGLGDPELVGSLPTPDSAFGVDLAGSLAFVAADEAGLLVVDISDPASPTITGAHVTVEGARNVCVADDHAFVAVRSAGLEIVDYSDPGNPATLVVVDTPGLATAVEIVGDHVYVADGTGGLQIINVAEPAAAEIVGSLELPKSVYGLAIQGDVAYLAGSPSFLYGVDIADPTAPSLTAEFSFPWIGYGLSVAGDFLYCPGSRSGLHVFDVSDSAEPEFVGTIGPPAPVLESDLEEVIGFTALHQDKIVYGGVDTGLLHAPLQCGESLPGLEVAIDLKPGFGGDRINCSSRGVIPVAILSTPEFDALSVDHETVVFGPGEAHETHENRHGVRRHEKDVDFDGDVDLLFHFRTEEAALDCTHPVAELRGTTFGGEEIYGSASFVAAPNFEGRRNGSFGLRAQPNPFNPQTKISFELDRQELITLRVFNIGGRLVRELITTEFLAPGPHEIVWYGKDDAGRQVASGTYFYRLESGSFSETKRMVLVK